MIHGLGRGWPALAAAAGVAALTKLAASVTLKVPLLWLKVGGEKPPAARLTVPPLIDAAAAGDDLLLDDFALYDVTGWADAEIAATATNAIARGCAAPITATRSRASTGRTTCRPGVPVDGRTFEADCGNSGPCRTGRCFERNANQAGEALTRRDWRARSSHRATARLNA